MLRPIMSKSPAHTGKRIRKATICAFDISIFLVISVLSANSVPSITQKKIGNVATSSRNKLQKPESVFQDEKSAKSVLFPW